MFREQVGTFASVPTMTTPRPSYSNRSPRSVDIIKQSIKHSAAAMSSTTTTTTGLFQLVVGGVLAAERSIPGERCDCRHRGQDQIRPERVGSARSWHLLEERTQPQLLEARGTFLRSASPDFYSSADRCYLIDAFRPPPDDSGDGLVGRPNCCCQQHAGNGSNCCCPALAVTGEGNSCARMRATRQTESRTERSSPRRASPHLLLIGWSLTFGSILNFAFIFLK